MVLPSCSRLGVSALLLVPVALSLASAQEVAWSTPFTVKGQVDFAKRDRIDAAQLREYPPVIFSIQVEPSQWSVRIEGLDDEAFDYREAASDGITLYYVNCFETAVQRMRERGETTGDNIVNAWVYSGEILHNSFGHQIAPVWLAYGSSRFLDGNLAGWMEPVITYGAPSDVYSYQNRYLQEVLIDREPQPPSLPSTVVFLHDGMIRSMTEAELQIPLRTPWHQGFTNAVYQVLSWTNIGSLRLPLESELRTFRTTAEPQRRTSDELILYALYRIRLDSARLGAAVQFPPILPGVAVVSETRLPGVSAIPYESRTGRWLAPEALMQTDLYLSKIGARSSAGIRRTIMIVVIGLIALLPVLHLAFASRKHHNSKH